SDFFRGDTGGRASGRSRGGATRDETCLINPVAPIFEAEAIESGFPATTVADLEASNLESDSIEGETATANSVTEAAAMADAEAEAASTNVQEIVILALEDQHKTTQANPDFFLYVPFDRDTYNMVLRFKLTTIEADDSRQLVDEPILLALPKQPGIVQFQLPDEISLEVGETYEWTFSLICQGSQSAPEAETSVAALTVEDDAATIAPDSEGNVSQVDIEATPLDEEAMPLENATPLDENEVAISPEEPITESEEPTLNIGNIQISSLDIEAGTVDSPTATLPSVSQEVFGGIERVDASAELVTALATSESSNHYEAYRNSGIWFDMVSSLAAHTPSEWTQFLEIFDLEADVDPTPQLLAPLSSDSQ
ncbi:MAG: DUF928 domain-containing protein, partial [Cyanobacteria bacterium J06559_3]